MLVNLRALFGVLVDILLLRRGPEHLPASPLLLGIAVALNVVLYAIGNQLFPLPLTPEPAATLFVKILAGALLTLLWFRIALQLAGKSERFVQTMTAMFAANSMAIFALPLLSELMQYAGKPGGNPAPIMLLLVAAVVGIWMLAVLVHIVKSAFEWSWLQAALLAIASNIGIAILLGLIFGESPKPS